MFCYCVFLLHWFGCWLLWPLMNLCRVVCRVGFPFVYCIDSIVADIYRQQVLVCLFGTHTLSSMPLMYWRGLLQYWCRHCWYSRFGRYVPLFLVDGDFPLLPFAFTVIPVVQSIPFRLCSGISSQARSPVCSSHYTRNNTFVRSVVWWIHMWLVCCRFCRLN